MTSLNVLQKLSKSPPAPATGLTEEAASAAFDRSALTATETT
jgi:hypothetical protein